MPAFQNRYPNLLQVQLIDILNLVKDNLKVSIHQNGDSTIVVNLMLDDTVISTSSCVLKSKGV